MKKVAIFFIVVLFAGCAPQIKGTWSIGEEPFFRHGLRVQVVNNLRHEVIISYRTWGDARIKRFSPGQEGMLTGLRNGEVLVARVMRDGEVIGDIAFRVSEKRGGGPQFWRISKYNRLKN